MDSLPTFEPHIRSLLGVPVERAFRALAGRRHCIFLDSARRGPELGRYSFIAADPFDTLTVSSNSTGEVEKLLQWQEKFVSNKQTGSLTELPPFQGGIAGLWSYDFARSLERVPLNRFDEFQLPVLSLGIYDVVVAFDHQRDESWIISQGFPETEPTARRRRSRERAELFEHWIHAWEGEAGKSPDSSSVAPGLNLDQLSNFHRVHELAGTTVYSNFSREAYLAAIRRAIEYIRAGDVFQVNLSQRLLVEASVASELLYLSLRDQNPAPFAGYYDLGDHQIISASPERFLQVRDRRVESRPIKGTRRRSITQPVADLFTGAELKASTKDLSENVMIVDLMRNDLSRVCEDDSVVVAKLCELEAYQHVLHLVSVVQGRLRDGLTPLELIDASFPGGSITGAPKVRAMEIIAELEPTARGAYCGSLGYLGFDGSMDLNILIRTITASGGWWQFPVGGGIVANSNPEEELQETWVKAQGMLRAISHCLTEAT